MNKMIEVGKVVNTRGLKGELKVVPYTDYPEFFEEIYGVYDKCEKYYEIEYVKYIKNTVILKLDGVDDANSADNMRGVMLYVERDDIGTLPPGVYLIADIIGLEVHDENKSYGFVTDVIQTGSNDVYVVEKEGEKPLLIPALKNVILETDIENKFIRVKLPEGLIE